MSTGGAGPQSEEEQRDIDKHVVETDVLMDAFSFVPGLGKMMDGYDIAAGAYGALTADNGREQSDSLAQMELGMMGMIPFLGEFVDAEALGYDVRRQDHFNETGEVLPSFAEKYAEDRWKSPTGANSRKSFGEPTDLPPEPVGPVGPVEFPIGPPFEEEPVCPLEEEPVCPLEEEPTCEDVLFYGMY